MQQQERITIGSILIIIALFLIFDIWDDYHDGAQWAHLIVEILMAIGALNGAFIILNGNFRLRHSLENAQVEIAIHKADVQKWRDQAQIHIKGLSREITRQLDAWELSASEKEIAFLLLKGLSIKEIANIRGTNEKTVRTQAVNIYQKSGLNGRADLSAFFLEDLLHLQD